MSSTSHFHERDFKNIFLEPQNVLCIFYNSDISIGVNVLPFVSCPGEFAFVALVFFSALFLLRCS